MAKKNKKRRRRPAREPTERPEYGPTPETVAKAKTARPDPLLEMIEAGLVDSAGERAADEIQRCYHAITYVTEINQNSMSAIAHGKSEMPDDVAQAIAERYNPWHELVGRVVSEAVKSVVIRRVAPLGGWRELVAEGLKSYARLF